MGERRRAQPRWLGAEEQHIAGLVVHLRVAKSAAGGEGEDPSIGQRVEARSERGVHLHLGEVVIVKTGPAQVLFAEIEAEWLAQVQGGARAGAHADGVAGIRGNHRVIKDYMGVGQGGAGVGNGRGVHVAPSYAAGV